MKFYLKFKIEAVDDAEKDWIREGKFRGTSQRVIMIPAESSDAEKMAVLEGLISDIRTFVPLYFEHGPTLAAEKFNP